MKADEPAFAPQSVSAPSDSGSTKPHRLMITAEDPDFHETLTFEFPSASSHPDMSTLLQFSVLLKAPTHAGLAAYTVIWTVQDGDAPDTTREIQSQVIRKHRQPRSQSSHVPAGRTRLVSPFYSLLPEHFVGRRHLVPAHILNNVPLRSMKVLSVELDAVILSSGKTTGNDRLNTRGLYTAVRNAEHDQAASVRYWAPQLNPAWDSDQLSSLLTSHIEKGRNITGSTQRDLWWSARGLEAAYLQKCLLSKGVPALQALVDRRLRYRRVHLATVPPEAI